MRVAVYQCESRPADVSANLDRMARATHDAAADDVDLLLFPEMFLSGYDIGAAAVHRLAEPRDGASAQEVAKIAREFGIAIVYGYPEHGAPATVFNAVQLIDSDGTSVANYRKTHLFGNLDRCMFSASAERPPWSTWTGGGSAC